MGRQPVNHNNENSTAVSKTRRQHAFSAGQRVQVTNPHSAYNGMVGTVIEVPEDPTTHTLHGGGYMVHFSAAQMRFCLLREGRSGRADARTVLFWALELGAL